MRKNNKLNYRIKENIISDDVEMFLNNKFNIKPIINKKINGGSSRRRPDILINMSGFNIIIEIDERQHYRYNKRNETIRNKEIYEDLGQYPLILIRFNPDWYIDKDLIKRKSLFIKDKKTKIYKIGYINKYLKRMETLKKIINHYIINGTEESIEIKLYFNFFSEDDIPVKI